MDTVAGKTMGFVGYGDIAKATAVLAKPLGLRLIALRRNPGKAATGQTMGDSLVAATYAPEAAAEFYGQCDFVVCTLPLTDLTRNSINAASFSAMKESAYFISLGRGAAVDEAALHVALQSGQIAGAACDVFATEPLPEDSPLWECENLLITSHNADLTIDYFKLGLDTWRENAECVVKGEPLATPVDLEAGY